ncbi:MBL fold metallo-hydrolase [Adhaeribacter swui]|uniref:MBL fold metallo-hydrolase n=1 Tax=Adhaeribacter swui TaxID=2086471 RepID=A0A7G7GD48_9BACT|nr:MBL fold metallo-hydrolase [Adhaeribacter swui]QNF35082.1 MBL fold metallo-hydrolase [Adhaeribacter swui]
MATNFICTTCGVQYAVQTEPPAECKICTDDRQYVNWQGQTWTTLPEMQGKYRNQIELVEPNVYSIQTYPKFAIGQRAHLIQTPQGNILWDCITYLDEETIIRINELGGITAIAISHPHYFSTLVNWSQTFGEVPVHIHAQDKEWVMQSYSRIIFWDESTHIMPGNLLLIQCGGHFPGANVLYYPQASDGKGVIFSGDTIQVVMDRQSVSFMYSYPNLIPLNKPAILAIKQALEGLSFERMYGAFEAQIKQEARQAFDKSITRYLQIFE